MRRNVRYSIIVPVYNEAAVIAETYRRLTSTMVSIGEPYELIFVNDGSRDKTGELIEGYALLDASVRLLDFSRNFGHQIAITAGMDHAQGEAMVVIDGDLQDPPELIPLMIEQWKAGYEVVYARRSKRLGETWFKKTTASLFYRLLGSLAEVEIPLDTGDFRLIDRKVCDALLTLRERNRFVRGLVSWVGFKQTAIEYVREERLAGESKYPLKKMLRFSMDGITSFSTKPLKMASYLGALVAMGSILYLLLAMGQSIFTASSATGASIGMGTLMLLNGVVLIFVGILGEYIGRIYDESKNRPLYILRNKPKMEKVKLREVKFDVH